MSLFRQNVLRASRSISSERWWVENTASMSAGRADERGGLRKGRRGAARALTNERPVVMETIEPALLMRRAPGTCKRGLLSPEHSSARTSRTCGRARRRLPERARRSPSPLIKRSRLGPCYFARQTASAHCSPHFSSEMQTFSCFRSRLKQGHATLKDRTNGQISN